MRHLFIINPAAGKPETTWQLEEQLRGVHFPYETAYTRKSGDALRIARAAAETGEPVRIYACGGDGTLNEAVNGAAGFANAAVTNVPKGTGNDFLKIFGADYRSRFSDLAALADGPQACFDLMDCNGRLGIGVVCAGVDARVAADVHRYKALPLVTGMGAYILSLTVNVLFKGIARPTVVEVGGRRMEEDTSIICICNGRYYGGGFMPVGDAMPDDGVLNFLIIPAVSRLTVLALIKKFARGEAGEIPGVILRQGREMKVACDRMSMINLDGERVDGTELSARLSDQKVNFIYPAGAVWR